MKGGLQLYHGFRVLALHQRACVISDCHAVEIRQRLSQKMSCTRIKARAHMHACAQTQCIQCHAVPCGATQFLLVVVSLIIHLYLCVCVSYLLCLSAFLYFFLLIMHVYLFCMSVSLPVSFTFQSQITHK